MLAVFNKSVAKCPEGLKNSEFKGNGNGNGNGSSLKDDFLLHYFSSVYPDSVSVNLGASGILAFSSLNQNPLMPRLFAVVDDIFCLFYGQIENIASLKQLYGLTKNANEINIIIEAYRSVRDRGSHPANHALRAIEGKFAFVIYDGSLKSTFVSVDADGSVPLFWGTDAAENVVFSDSEDVVKKVCLKSLAPFPKGCFFTSDGGLKSYEYPLKELKAVPWKDGSGEECGSTFVVVEDSEKTNKKVGVGAAMPRVDSDADWSKHI